MREPDEVAAVLRSARALQPEERVVDPSEHGARLKAITGLRIEISGVRAKFKYGATSSRAHRGGRRTPGGPRPRRRGRLRQLQRRIDR